MNKNKKITILLCTISMVLSIAACGQVTEEDSVTSQQEIGVEMTAEELLDLFINGSIDAIDSAD